MEEGLTQKQADVYNAIVKFTIENNYPPTINEICKMINKSSGSVQSCLKILKRKNFVEWETNKSRTLKAVYDR